MSRQFTGKTALVTGASKGIGRACAKALAEQGAEVIAVARTAADLRSLAEETDGTVRECPCDARSQELLDLIAAEPRLDILVNNVGSNQPEPFNTVQSATLDWLLALNVRTAFLVAQASARKMLERREGAIVHMSSQMGHVGAANRTVYCMTKHAIEGLSKAMAVELAPRGIRVNTVAPTYIETPLTRPMFEDPAFKAEVLSKIPLGRMGAVEDVASAVCYLASDAARMVTGTSLLVDGGWTAV